LSAARKLTSTDDGATPFDTFLDFLARGFWPVVIYPRGAKIPGRPEPAKGKEPIGKAWGLERWTVERAKATFRRFPDAGVGICLGPGRAPDGEWLIDIEGDGPEVEASRAKLLGGELVESMGWRSARGGHGLGTADPDRLGPIMPGLRPLEGKGQRAGVYKSDQLPGLELRLGGYKSAEVVKQVQSVVPPTPGTDGEPRQWTGSQTVASVPDAFYQVLAGLVAPPKADSPPLGSEERVDPFARDPSEPNPAGGHFAGKAPDASKLGARNNDWTAEQRAVAYLQKCEPAVSGQRGHDKAFKAACKVGPGFNLAPDTLLRLLLETYNPTCKPPWSETELRHKVDEAYKVETRRGWLLEGDRSPRIHRPDEDGPPGDGQSRGGSPGVGRKKPFNRTDLGNAERLVARHGHDLRYCHAWNRWLVWDGRRWAVDKSGDARRRSYETVRSIYQEANREEDEDARKALAKWAVQSENAARIAAMIHLAEAKDGIPILHDEMDADPWSFNCANGTIDLKTGKLRPHRREDLITGLSPVAFDPDAKCVLWESTLDLFFKASRELIDYFQAICGCAMAGVIRDHIMPVAYGHGSNGKSTMLGTIGEVFGTDYAMKCATDMLMAKKTDSHPTDRADLFRKRLVVAIETESGRHLNETMVKELTGGDKIRARQMRQDFWEFHPTHTLILATNHKPVIRGTDHGIWRRLRLIPFNVSVDGAKADKRMPERLKAEYRGILAWCVRGCLEWQAGGLKEPKQVTDASKDYRKEQDIVGSFLNQCTIEHLTLRVRAGQVFDRYKKWCEASNERPMSLTKFGTAIEERGIEKHDSNGTWYLGIQLRDPQGEREVGVIP